MKYPNHKDWERTATPQEIKARDKIEKKAKKLGIPPSELEDEYDMELGILIGIIKKPAIHVAGYSQSVNQN